MKKVLTITDKTKAVPITETSSRSKLGFFFGLARLGKLRFITLHILTHKPLENNESLQKTAGFRCLKG